MLNQDGIYKLKFTEPGGVVEAGVMVKNHDIIQCMMAEISNWREKRLSEEICPEKNKQ